MCLAGVATQGAPLSTDGRAARDQHDRLTTIAPVNPSRRNLTRRAVLRSLTAAALGSLGSPRTGAGAAPLPSLAAAHANEVLVPAVDGAWWRVAGNPDLGPLAHPRQQPVDFGIWQAADGTWQLWSCIRFTRAPGKTRLFHRWQGDRLTDGDWRPMGIAMQADPRVGETAGGLQAPFVLEAGGTYHMFYGDWEHVCLALSVDGKAFTPYTYDPQAKPKTDFGGSSSAIWNAQPAYDWRVLPLGKALAFDSAPLSQQVVMAGPGSVDLWLRSSATDTDLETTLTEIRPDGHEVYVQNGWLRASHRALDASASTALQPSHSDAEADAAPLPAGQFVEARVALFPFAHVFRPGSRLRITVEAPGGNRPFWTFADLPANGSVVNEVAHSVGHASKVVLPVIPNASAPTAAPPCGTLRGQPCRPVVSSGAPTRVSSRAADNDVTVTWTKPALRPSSAIASYQVTEQPGGRTLTASASATTATFTNLPPGPHSVGVVVSYATHDRVAATPSNTVTTPGPHVSESSTTTSTTSAGGTVAAAASTTSTTLGTAAPSSGNLPFTGGALTTLVGAAILLLGAGTFLARRRPRRRGDSASGLALGAHARRPPR